MHLKNLPLFSINTLVLDDVVHGLLHFFFNGGDIFGETKTFFTMKKKKTPHSHESSIASLVTLGSRTVNEVLFRDGDKILGLDLVASLS